jgi:uncharacterized protein involved in exopolysaccharide biosynthesis
MESSRCVQCAEEGESCEADDPDDLQRRSRLFSPTVQLLQMELEQVRRKLQDCKDELNVDRNKWVAKGLELRSKSKLIQPQLDDIRPIVEGMRAMLVEAERS